jgi:hypothetical protein
MLGWSELASRVILRTMAVAQHYNGAPLPMDAALPEGVYFDYVDVATSVIQP